MINSCSRAPIEGTYSCFLARTFSWHCRGSGKVVVKHQRQCGPAELLAPSPKPLTAPSCKKIAKQATVAFAVMGHLWSLCFFCRLLPTASNKSNPCLEAGATALAVLLWAHDASSSNPFYMWRDPIVTSLQACTLFFVQCPALCADSAWAVSSLSLGGASALFACLAAGCNCTQ